MKKSIAFLLTVIIAFGCFGMVNIPTAAEASSDSVSFGVYYQEKVTQLSTLRKLRKADFDDDGHTVVEGIKYAKSGDEYFVATPIEWNIVGSEGGYFILLSKYVLFNGDSNGSDFYSGGSLRKWLNSTFIDLAFTQSELADMGMDFVNYESVYPYTDPELNISPYDTNTGGNLKGYILHDYVSIPTKEDIEQNFKEGSYDKKAYTTEYVDSNKGLSQYWLRGPALWYYGNPSWYYVNTDGSINSWYSTWSKGIRPVIKVSKNSIKLFRGKTQCLFDLSDKEFTFNVYDKDTFRTISTFGKEKEGLDSTHHKVKGFKLDCYKECFSALDDENVVKVPYSYIGTSAVKISAQKYRDFLIPMKVAENWRGLIDNYTAFMQRDKNDGLPYVSSVFGKDYANKDDPFHEIQTETLANINSGSDSHIIISAVGAQKGATYYLTQGGTRSFESNTGEFVIDLNEKFVDGKDTYAYFINPDGTRCDPVKININLKRYTEAAKNLLKLTSWNLLGKSGLSATLGDDMPIVSGLELGFEAFTCPIGMEVDENSVKISLGLNIFEYSDPKQKLEKGTKWKDLKSKDERWSVFKNEFKGVKDNLDDKLDAKKTIDDFKKRYDPSKSKSNSIVSDTLQKKSFSFDVSVAGYLEFQFVDIQTEDGQWYRDAVLTDGDGAFAISLDVEKTFQTFAGPGFPTYGYLEFGFDAKAGVKFSTLMPDDFIPQNDLPIKSGWYVSVEPKARAGYGAGFKGYLSAGMYGELTFPILFDAMERRTTVKMKGNLGFEGEVFLLEADWPIFEGETVLYDNYWNNNKKSSGVGANGDDYTVAAKSTGLRDYIQNTSDWLPGTEDVSVSAADGIASVQTLQQSVYPNSNAKLVRFGDRLMAVWMDDDKTRGDINRARLVYSVCNAALLDWSEPRAVDDNGRMDYYPEILSDGNTIYLAWQNSSKTFDGDSVSLTDVMNSFDIKAAKYNAADDSFETVTLAENNTYDFCQTVTLENGKPVVYWVQNDNTAFDGNGYSIMKYSFDTKTTELVRSELNSIYGLAVSGGKAAYLMDADGNAGDSTDVYLYIDGSRIAADELPDQTVTYVTAAKFGEKEVFLASVSGGTFITDGQTTESFTNNSLLVDGNLNIVDCNGKTRLLWTGTKDEKNVVFSAEYGDNGICEPVVLATSDNVITNLSAVYCGNAVYAVYNSREYDSEKERLGNADFNCLTMRDFTDIGVNLPAFSDSELEREQTSALSVEIINNGTNRVNTVTVKVTDGAGTDMAADYTVNLAAGESTVISVPYAVPALTGPTELTVEASVNGDVNINDNSVTVGIGKPDIMFRKINVTEVEDYYVVSCPFWNDGLTDADGVSLELSCGEEMIESAFVGTATAYAHFVKDFFVPKGAIKYTDGQAKLTVSASSVSDERSTDNNSQSFILTEKAKSETIYFKNNAEYDDVHIYCWNDGGKVNASWPGENMTYLYDEDGMGVYAYTPQQHFDKIIFNNGSSNKQTVDIALSNYSGNLFVISNPEENAKHTVVSSEYSPIPDDVLSVIGSEPPFESNLMGDVNNDGKLSIRDVTCIQLHISSQRLLTGKSLELADYDGNGEVNIMDATALQKAIALVWRG